jgi:hypothetical protein
MSNLIYYDKHSESIDAQRFSRLIPRRIPSSSHDLLLCSLISFTNNALPTTLGTGSRDSGEAVPYPNVQIPLPRGVRCLFHNCLRLGNELVEAPVISFFFWSLLHTPVVINRFFILFASVEHGVEKGKFL